MDMRVFLDYKLNNSGKGKFLKRLIPELEKIGVRIQFNPKGAHVALGITKWRTKAGMPKVLRLDGIHLVGNNFKIRKSIKQSDLLIYQSQFAKKFIEKKLKVKKRNVVIYNGASPKVSKERSGFFMAAHWGNRKHKCLHKHIEFATERQHDTFYLAGKVNIPVPSNVVLLGEISDRKMANYQSKCEYFVYLADLDWCPNVVVEAITSGMRIIYNRECEAVRELCGLNPKQLYIENIAKQYLGALSSVQ